MASIWASFQDDLTGLTVFFQSNPWGKIIFLASVIFWLAFVVSMAKAPEMYLGRFYVWQKMKVAFIWRYVLTAFATLYVMGFARLLSGLSTVIALGIMTVLMLYYRKDA